MKRTAGEKKRRRARWKRCLNGSISILLCLLLTPFLTITLGLVEYARYQQVLELTNEVFELTGISALSDYDLYLHDRFGLLAVSQEKDFGKDAEESLKGNLKSLGAQAELESAALAGKLSLSNPELFRQQILDVSELTVPAAILAEDFNLDELMEKLNASAQFQQIINTVKGMAKLASALADAVKALKNLQKAVDSLKSDVDDVSIKAKQLADDMGAFYKELNEKGITLPKDATEEEIKTALASFDREYVDRLKDLYGEGKELLNAINRLKKDLDDLPDSLDAFKKAIEGAKSALSSFGNTEDPSKGQASGSAKTTLEEILNEMSGLVDETLADIKQDTIAAIQEACDEIKNELLNACGLNGLLERYEQIVNGDYFKLPLSDLAKQDLTELLKTVKEVCDSHDPSSLGTFFRSKLIPDLSKINFSNILSKINSTLKNAEQRIWKGALEKAVKLITSLVNLVKKIFDFDIFYDPDLNANVSTGSAADSPYQDFLNGLGKLFGALTDLGSGGLISRLRAVANMCSAIVSILTAVGEAAASLIGNLASLAGGVLRGNSGALYERLLISGYVRHNLPSRVDCGALESQGGSIYQAISGMGITGFSYANIARQEKLSASFEAPEGGNTKFEDLSLVLQSLKGGGEDRTFQGAELEYICAGTNSELANQVFTFMNLYFLRLILDLGSVLMDPNVAETAAAATLAAWAVYILYILVEPFCDMLLLVNGEKVPLVKTRCWLTKAKIGKFVTMLADAVSDVEELKNMVAGLGGDAKPDEKEDGGLLDRGYGTHVLLLLLLTVPAENQIRRLQDLAVMETEEYYRRAGKEFTMDKAYTAVEVSGGVRFQPFFDLGVASGGAPLLPELQITRMVSY